jgi:dihydrofolate synthase / folylpolyglutamate synthase
MTTKPMTYQEAVRYLLTLGRELAAPRQPAPPGLSAAEGSRATGEHAQKFDLRNITALAERLGHPQRQYPSVHIAGTNGKGSTAAMVDSILRAAGLRTGLYTSPHLERINERIRIDGEEISDAEFAASFTRVQALVEELMASGALAAHPTYFECLTAMAFEAFARLEIDFGVFEVGMGGRLDATNVLAPEVAVLTQIDFDHENYLGHSIEQIAAEKAGIIKPGAWVVSTAERSEARAVVARRAAEQGARLVEIDAAWRLEGVHSSGGWYRATAAATHSALRLELAPSLAGRFQLRNALAAATAARLLAERGFPADAAGIERGIREARWPGRLERVRECPAVYLDGTHNPAGARELLAFWEENFAGRRILLVYGAMRDKAVDEITGLLFPHVATVVLTQPHQPRAISAEVLASMSGHLAKEVEVIADPEEALARALELARPEDAVFATGSLYLVGDLRCAARELASGRAPALPAARRLR